MRRVISRPPTRPATSALAPLGWLPHPARTSSLDTTDGSRSCQPQLSFIVPTIYGSVYTSADTTPFQAVPNFPAIHQRAIARISLPTTAQHAAGTCSLPRATFCRGRVSPRCVARVPFLLRSPHRTPPFARYVTSPPCTRRCSPVFFFLFRLFPSRRRRTTSELTIDHGQVETRRFE